MTNLSQGELSQNRSQLIISGEEIPFGAYQAIYHKLTRKVETSIKRYKGVYIVGFDDISSLNTRLSQCLKQFQVKAFRCEVAHSLKDDHTILHSSFEKFKFSDQSFRSCTLNLTYQIDFLIILPPEVPEASEIAQRYKMQLSINQDFLDPGDEEPEYYWRFLRLGENISLNFEYSDYAVYQTLRSVVDGWIETLPKSNSSDRINDLLSLVRSSRAWFSAIIYFIFIMVGIRFINNNGPVSASNAAKVILITLGISSLFSTVLDSLLSNISILLMKIKGQTFILLTNGDSSRKIETEKRRSSTKSAISFLFVFVGGTIILNIFSSWIYELLIK